MDMTLEQAKKIILDAYHSKGSLNRLMVRDNLVVLSWAKRALMEENDFDKELCENLYYFLKRQGVSKDAVYKLGSRKKKEDSKKDSFKEKLI